MPSVVAATPKPLDVAEVKANNAMTTVKMTPEQKFEATDFTDKDQIVALFPSYIQEQHALRKARAKNITNGVNIECFNMKTPYGDRHLLQNTKLILEPNKRQALIGANATGKTLLFTNMMSGQIKEFPKHLHVHHCRELENEELHDTVINTVVNCYPYRNILLQCEEKIKQLLAAGPDAETKEKLEGSLFFVQSQATQIKAYDAKTRAEKMLRVLGFDEVGQNRLVSALSGGLRMRVALCMAFFIEADMLLLDEPTNHLDFPSVLWLENRLRGYKGSFLLVSHDRELLNNVCTAILLIENKQIKYYNMDFKSFEIKKAAEDKKTCDDVEKFLKRNMNPDPSTALGRERYDKKEWLEQYMMKQTALAGKFTFPESVALENKEIDPATGQLVAPDQITLIDLKDVRFSYNPALGHFIFNDPISFRVGATTRVGVMGPNGAGKSTLLKLLTHKLTPTEGTVTHHPQFTLAYFGQHSTAELNLELTAAEFMGQQFPKESAGRLRGHLAKTGVVGAVQDTRMMSLSYSQRSCIVFAKLTYICPHLLILDEPTNFLDLESVDSLISACNKYKGALLLVSHNRDFLKKCAKEYLSVVPGHFKLYDKLKAAENATYTFIAEMEEGGKVDHKGMIMNNPGGGSIHSSQKVGAAEEKKDDTTSNVQISENGSKIITMSMASATPAPKPVAAPVGPVYEVNEKVQALWTDGKWYPGVVKAIKGAEYSVLYTQYGNVATLPNASLKKVEAKPQGKGAGKGAGKGPAASGGAKPAGAAKGQGKKH